MRKAVEQRLPASNDLPQAGHRQDASHEWGNAVGHVRH